MELFSNETAHCRLRYEAAIRRGWTVRIEWRPALCWIGCTWQHRAEPAGYGKVRLGGRVLRRLDIWVCLLPMMPLHLSRMWEAKS